MRYAHPENSLVEAAGLLSQKKSGSKGDKLAAKNNLYYSTTVPAFKNIDLGELVIYQIDIHPNSKANHIFADTIYNDLMNKELLNRNHLEVPIDGQPKFCNI